MRMCDRMEGCTDSICCTNNICPGIGKFEGSTSVDTTSAGEYMKTGGAGWHTAVWIKNENYQIHENGKITGMRSISVIFLSNI